MFNYASYCKRFSFVIIFFLLISCFSIKSNKYVLAADKDLQQELDNNIENILDKTDFSSLDDSVYSVPELNLSFRDFVKTILNDEQSLDYNVLISKIKDVFFKQIKDNLRFFVILFIVIFYMKSLNLLQI